MGTARRGESGQIAVLFALVFTFLFIMFGFVVDFANLVNNKINLQNAADAAAYAGAAYEAQALNRLSMVNYRLRQNTKELVMRALVTHLRHNRNFPRGNSFINGGDQAAQVQPFMCQQAHGYVALSGLRYANDTNLCRNASPETGGLPPIVVPPVIASFDPFAVAIAAQIRRIAEASNQECRAAALDNRALADHLIQVFTLRSQFHAQQANKIVSFINSIKDQSGTMTADSGSSNPIVAAAYQSALRNLTLGNHDDFKMDIIQPEGGQDYVRIKPYNLNASMFFFDFNVVGNGCVGNPKFEDFSNMIAGYSKDQAILTYFAVRLRASPKMMFMPQSWVDAAFPEITAFSAAKPFGSRIGPDEGADELLPVPNRPGNINRMLNFSFVPGDQLGMRNAKMMAYFDALHPFTNGPPDGNKNTGWPDAGTNVSDLQHQAMVAIRAPTVFDAMFYTIFPDPNRPNDYEESQGPLGDGVSTAFYPDHFQTGDVNNAIVESDPPSTPPYFDGDKIPAYDNADQSGAAYGSYAVEAPASHSVAIAGGAGLPLIQDGNAAQFGFATRDMVHSGWSPQRDASHNQGRIGYSVKFISFDALRRTIQVRRSDTGQRGGIDNKPSIDDPNIDQIYH